ncbi:MAG: hypothetical protein JXR10_15550 [Cyclobacteriaceae bacterium]
MDITSRFSSTQGSREQHLNKLLAKEIVDNHEEEFIHQINKVLLSGAKLDIIADALKVIEMVGQAKPEMVKMTLSSVMKLLDHKSNKIQWRAMSALSTFGHLSLKLIYEELGKILMIMDAGSVITRDHGIKLLVAMYQQPEWQNDLASLLEEQLLAAPDNQLGQYAEKWLEVITPAHHSRLKHILEGRLPELVSPSHQKRISRVLKKLEKQRQK